MGRVAWTGLLLLVAIAATGLQMDRQTTHDNALAYKVPSFARAYALPFLARDAYENGDVEQGLAYSRSLVLRRPIPGENFGLLSYGLFQTGQADAGMAALLISAQRGWRSPFTQTTMVKLALQANDPATAAQRTLALWRTASVMPTTKALTGMLFDAPGGMKAFTAGMLPRDRWGTDLLIWAIGTQRRVLQLEILSQAIAGRGMTVSCPRLVQPLRKLARTGSAASVARVWSRLCAPSSAAKDRNFAFNDASAQGPLDWIYPEQAGLSRDGPGGEGQSRIKFRNSEFRTAVLAKRMTALPPGEHAIRMTGGEGVGDLTFRVECFDGRDTRRNVFKGAPVGGAVKFALPPACVGQEISILADRGEGSVGPLTID